MKPYRAAMGLALMLAAAACEREGPKRVLVERTKVPASAPKPSSALTGAPTKDGAFVSKTDACRAPYEEVLATCVHQDYRARVSRSELEYQLALYRRGASSPRADGALTGAAGAAPVALDPSALTVSKADDNESARDVTQARLKALDDVLTSVRDSVLSSRVERLRRQASEPARPTTADTPTAGAANAGLLADDDNIAGPPDDALGSNAPAEANIAGPPDRELGLDGRSGREEGSSELRARMDQIRQIQTFLHEMPLEQREAILRKLESSGARSELGDETWSELVSPAPNPRPSR